MLRQRNRTLSQPQISPAPSVISTTEWNHALDSLCLPPQQVRTIGLLFQGMGDKQIALEMRISVPTVRSHLRRLFNRLGASDRMDLAFRFIAASRDGNEQP